MGSGTSVEMSNEPHIVVVGGGYAGTALCGILKSAQANFTLVDCRDAMHHSIAAVRAIVKPGTSFIGQTMIPLEATFGYRFKKGKMVGVEPGNNRIHLEGGQTLKYDILVIATGSVNTFPAKYGDLDKREAIDAYEAYGRKLKSKKRIAIVGGGAVGVEIAGEIATEYPDKQVTVINGGKDLIMQGLNQAFYRKIDHALQKLNVKVLQGEKVTNLEQVGEGPGTLYTDKNNAIEADFVIPATGVAINKDGYLSGLGHVVNERGMLSVNKSFQVQGFHNIFSMGDCANTGDNLVAFLAMEHAKFVAKNISRHLSGQSLLEYKGHDHKFKIGVSVGKNYGFGELKSGTMVPDFFIKKAKSSDLMVKTTWKKFGQKPPK